jgi:cephalosporin-C deacetylase-like acetyl esterase
LKSPEQSWPLIEPKGQAMRTSSLAFLFPLVLAIPLFVHAGDPLPGTAKLEEEGDLASTMISGIDRFLLKQIEESQDTRDKNWSGVVLPSGLFAESNQKASELRAKLAKMLGVVDTRVGDGRIEIVESFREIVSEAQEATANSTANDPTKGPTVRVIRWPVLEGVWGEGLLIEPERLEGKSNPPLMNVIAITDADQTPEQLAGLSDGIEAKHQWARILASANCRVFIPTLINRKVAKRGPPGEAGRAELSSREFVYRPAFEMGRQTIGYEIQQVLALVDLLTDSKQSNSSQSTPISVAGYGEGGFVALASAALDTRIDSTLVSGYFGPREDSWKEPICRNIFGQLNYFSDAEMAALVFPRHLVVDFRDGPSVALRTQGGAPGILHSHPKEKMISECGRLLSLVKLKLPSLQPSASPSGFDVRPSGTGTEVKWLFSSAPSKNENTASDLLVDLVNGNAARGNSSQVVRPSNLPDDSLRQTRLVNQLIEHTQKLLYDSAKVRRKYFSQLDTKSIGNYEKSIEPYRKTFSEELIGQFDLPLLPPAPKSRQTWDSEKWTGYEVMLDVFPDVVAYGALLLPKDLKAGEKRPVVVCQHGLEGRPTDVFLGDHNAYHDYAAKLCDRGYIVFAPQNIYIFQDRFRTLQRKANPLGKTLFSIMVPQHQQIVNWLKGLPNVDADRIAFYGLSYGGKSAMRIPALVKDYCLSICSADFNEWIVKNASTTHPFSYVWTGEYEIFEFNLGNTFNYAEMASLICPRPFMVERGHFDGVGEDEWVGFEFAKVQNLYQARLGIGDRTEIEWFIGPHTINGKGTFEFLDRNLLRK